MTMNLSKWFGFASSMLLFGCSVDVPSAFFANQVDVSGANEEEISSETSDDIEEEESETSGNDQNECSSIEDCPSLEDQPCLQPNCSGGVCGEQPAPSSTDCLAEELDSTCATALCSGSGECEVTLFEAGTSCLPDGVETVGECQVFACDGEGLCVAGNAEDGQLCTPTDATNNLCEVRKCLGGVCELDPFVCNDSASCSEDRCVTYEACLGIEDASITPEKIMECALTMQTGAWDCTPDGNCDSPLREYSLVAKAVDEAESLDSDFEEGTVVVAWCNTELSGKNGHDNGGCLLPYEGWNDFKGRLNLNAEGASNGFCDYENGSGLDTVQCDDLNSCTDDTCEPGFSLADAETGCVHEAKAVDSECSGIEFCNAGLEATCQATGDDDTVTCELVEGAKEALCALDSPCVLMECNGKTGLCEPQANWEEGAPAPSCIADKLGGMGLTPLEGDVCGLGKCERCEVGQPNCDGAICVPASTFGMSCSSETASLCANTTTNGPAACVDSSDGESKECRVPCRSFQSDCFSCFYDLATFDKCTEIFVGEYLLNPTNGNCQEILAPNLEGFLSSKEWKEAVTVCLPELLPAHLPSKELDDYFPDFVSVGTEAISPCFTDILSKNEFVNSLNQKNQENLVTCSLKGILNAMKTEGFESCEEPVDNCAALQPVDGLGEAICSDKTFEPYLIFGAYKYNAPYCIRACVLESGAPQTLCGD